MKPSIYFKQAIMPDRHTLAITIELNEEILKTIKRRMIPNEHQAFGLENTFTYHVTYESGAVTPTFTLIDIEKEHPIWYLLSRFAHNVLDRIMINEAIGELPFKTLENDMSLHYDTVTWLTSPDLYKIVGDMMEHYKNEKTVNPKKPTPYRIATIQPPLETAPFHLRVKNPTILSEQTNQLDVRMTLEMKNDVIAQLNDRSGLPETVEIEPELTDKTVDVTVRFEYGDASIRATLQGRDGSDHPYWADIALSVRSLLHNWVIMNQFDGETVEDYECTFDTIGYNFTGQFKIEPSDLDIARTIGQKINELSTAVLNTEPPNEATLVGTDTLRLVHIPQVPGEAFIVEVENVQEAKRITHMLASYDAFLYEEDIRGDYNNVTSLEVYDVDSGEWSDWYDDETGLCFKDYTDRLAEKDASCENE